MTRHKDLKGIRQIRYGITWFEELINILSGPLLAISATVAIIDLLTDGHIHTPIQPLAIFWAGCQGFGLDFQLLSLGYKARNAWHHHKKGSFVGILIVAIALGAVALQSGAIFATQGAQNEGITTALAQLGINPTFLIYERASLAVVLIFIAGWNKHNALEEEENATHASSLISPAQLASDLMPHLTPLLVTLTRTIITEQAQAVVLPSQQAQLTEPHAQETGTDRNTTPEPATDLLGTMTPEERLAHAYAAIRSEGGRVSGETLSKRAKVRKETTLAWLRANGTNEEQSELVKEQTPTKPS